MPGKEILFAAAILCGLTSIVISQDVIKNDVAPNGAAPTSATIDECLVKVINEAQVAAQEGGVLTAVEATEGLDVETGALLAQLDESVPLSEKLIAQAEELGAKMEAENTTEERVAKATVEVARAEFEQVQEANRRAPGAKSQAEVNIKRYTVYKSQAQVDQARVTREIAAVKAKAAAQKVKAADLAIDRRKIKAPLTGKVIKVFLHNGEWANPGDPVMHVVRLDRLRVVGFVDARQFNPADLHARPATLNVQLSGGRPATFEGKITFVNPTIEPGTSQFQIYAEVANRKEKGEWILQSGLGGTLVIDLTHRLEQREAAKEQPASPATTKVR